MVLDTGPGRSVVNLRLKPYYCRTVYSCTLYLESKRADCFLGCTRMWKRLVVYHPRLPLPCLQLGTVAMARVCKLTALIVLVFATVCASAGACADGSSPGSNGCCAATLECPTCCLLTGKQTSSPTPDASSTTCTCSGCTGESVEINATCVYDDCVARGISAFRFGVCEYCATYDVSTGGTYGEFCMPNQAAVSACSNVAAGGTMSISSSGLISCPGSGSGGNTCDACCPDGCDSPEDGSKPECAACLACNTRGTCPEDSAAASLGSGALGTTLLAAVATTALLCGLLF